MGLHIHFKEQYRRGSALAQPLHTMIVKLSLEALEHLKSQCRSMLVTQVLHSGKSLFAALCLLATSTAYSAGEKTPPGDLEFTECTIGSGASALVAQCATLSVPLDAAKFGIGTDQAPQIELSIARIPARRQSSRQDAFTMIAGGPGQSAIESFPAVSFAFRHIMRNHDVILIDQRGTGESEKLVCEEAPDSMGLDAEVDEEEISKLARECRESLEHDPRWFTTSMAAHDLENVRQQLGVSQWNMYGISYGTRAALHYLRRYPESIRTLTLDAVVPPDIALGPDIARLSQRALDLIFQRCRDNQGCAEAFGDLSEPTMELLESLEAQPRTISFEDVASGKLSTMEFTRDHLAVTIRLMSYSAQTAAILPSMLHDAIENDNFAPLARQSKLQTKSLGNSLATGMHHAIVCTEDAPFVDSSGNAEDANTYLGKGAVKSLLASCEHWPPGEMDADFKDPVVSGAPTLILSGEADPITPPDYGESLVEHLKNARHIVNPHQGHMQAPFGCMPVLLAKFVESADATALDASCLERLRAPPFFVDANGPLP